MALKTKDRRVSRTRRLLHQALHELMGEKRYADITVQDIIDRADVGRSTFYAHYQDKEDLATSVLIQIMDGLAAAMAEVDPHDRQILPTLELFQHVEEQYELFKIMMVDRGMEFFLVKGREYWSARLEQRLQFFLPEGGTPLVPIPLIAASAAGTFAILFKWWIDNKMPYPAEEMAQFADQLILPGVWEALGVE